MCGRGSVDGGRGRGAVLAERAEPVDAHEDRHQDDGQHDDDEGVADRGAVADLLDVEEGVGVPVDDRTSDERVRDPGDGPQERPRDRAAVDARTGAEQQPAQQGRPGRDVVEADRGDQLPAARVHVVDQDQVEDEPCDGDAEQGVETQDPPDPSVALGIGDQGRRDDEHQDVALDGEEAQRLDQAGADAHGGDRLAGVGIRSAGQHQRDLDDQRGDHIDDDEQVPDA